MVFVLNFLDSSSTVCWFEVGNQDEIFLWSLLFFPLLFIWRRRKPNFARLLSFARFSGNMRLRENYLLTVMHEFENCRFQSLPLDCLWFPLTRNHPGGTLLWFLSLCLIFLVLIASGTSHPCADNGGCSHMCRPVNGRPVCICPVGYKLLDGFWCVLKTSNCSKDQFTCANGQCITRSYLCDTDDDCADKSDELDIVCGKYIHWMPSTCFQMT